MSEQATFDPKDPKSRMSGDPYCGECGYNLRGVTESAKCPECGRALVDVLVRHRGPIKGSRSRRYRSETIVFGLPLVDVATGPRLEFDEPYGRAKGIIAIGDTATGGIAIGGRAVGIVAIGGGAVGCFSMGGGAIGLFTAVGGGAIGLGFSAGGAAIGSLASGGGAIGVVAQGGGALGVYARGGGAIGKYTNPMGNQNRDQEAVDMFKDLSWYFGTGKATQPFSMIGPALLTNMAIMVLVSCLIVVIAQLRRKMTESSV